MTIKIGGGRSVSVRTPEEDSELLKKELEGLSADEREALLLALKELTVDHEPVLYRKLDNVDWVREPVGMEEFISDPYYLGNTCDLCYPILRKDLFELFDDGTYREAIFTGAIGWGKTFTASIGICRLLYELSCMRDPHRSFGLAANSNISIVCLSVNELLATKVAYENIATKIEASPYFQEHFPFEKTKKELRFPKHIWVAARATTDNSVLGLNVIGGLLDETNFMQKKKGNDDPRFSLEGQAEVIYNAMQRRMKSRFERRGKLPGVLFVVSSKQTHDDFTAKRIRDSRGDSTIFVRDYSLWDVKPRDYFGGDWFHVLVGNESSPSRILREEEDPVIIQAHMGEGCVMIEVPVEYRNDFERDLEGAIRDLAGVATVAVSPYIQRREKIEECIDVSRKHPYTSESLDPSQAGRFLWENMVKRDVERDMDMMMAVNRPILNPRATRHIHIDPSLRGDCTGFCMGHVGGFVNVIRRGDDGMQFSERAPVIVVDLVLRIVPPLGDELQLGDLRKLIYQLSQRGYLITKVTMDSWQSAEAIQKLNQKGFNAELLSVDRTMDPYECLKSAIYERRISYYSYAPLIRELRELEHDRIKRKVDHPLRGSKDCSDALAGITYSLTESSLRSPLGVYRGPSTYTGDTWMAEQMQMVAAEQFRENHGMSADPYSGYDSIEPTSTLPPFLIGGSGDLEWNDK